MKGCVCVCLCVSAGSCPYLYVKLENLKKERQDDSVCIHHSSKY